jgi:hypothetical protein
MVDDIYVLLPMPENERREKREPTDLIEPQPRLHVFFYSGSKQVEKRLRQGIEKKKRRRKSNVTNQ